MPDAPDPMPEADTVPTRRTRSFLAELKRRKVWGVGLAYIGVALGVLQVGDLAEAAFALDDRLYRVMVLAATGGLPIVLVLAWVFDLTPLGVQVTPDSPSGESGDEITAPASTRFRSQLVAASVVGVILESCGTGPEPGVRLRGTKEATYPSV